MGINNTQMYEKVVQAMARQRVALEMLSYHSSATIEEVQRIKVLLFVLYIFKMISISMKVCMGTKLPT